MINKNIILSIKPKWASLIYSGQKKIECRKTKPKFLSPPFLVYLYETTTIKKVTGFFICNRITRIFTDELLQYNNIHQGCMSSDDLLKYTGKNPCIYAWEISEYVIFDRPKELKEYYYKGSPILRPPQSWQYIEY